MQGKKRGYWTEYAECYKPPYLSIPSSQNKDRFFFYSYRNKKKKKKEKYDKCIMIVTKKKRNPS